MRKQIDIDGAQKVLSPSELDMYDEFLEPSETRFSKTNIFVNYKEFHNRRNLVELDRSDKKTYFKKQTRIVNKDKQIDKRVPCWASDISMIRKVQNIQEKLIKANLLRDDLQFEEEAAKKQFLRPKIDHLCQLMDREYDINLKKLRKQREEQKK